MARNGTDRTIEIKLPDATGAAHCMIFGPSLGSGQGALTADKFVELNFLKGLVPAAAPQGVTRRYNIPGAPYRADLIAYSPASGDVVGFAFSGVPQNLTTRALSAADPQAEENDPAQVRDDDEEIRQPGAQSVEEPAPQRRFVS